jgi:hypothetical protein
MSVSFVLSCGAVLPDGMVYFQTKKTVWVNFGRSCKRRCWYFCMSIFSILRPNGMCYDNLVHLVYFSPFWYILPNKIWQPCCGELKFESDQDRTGIRKRPWSWQTNRLKLSSKKSIWKTFFGRIIHSGPKSTQPHPKGSWQICRDTILVSSNHWQKVNMFNICRYWSHCWLTGYPYIEVGISISWQFQSRKVYRKVQKT